MIGEELVARDPSFAELIKCFFCDVSSKPRIDQLKYILKFLDVLYQLLQQPLTIRNRTSLDNLLFTCLRLLSGVVYFYSARKYMTGRALPQGAIVRKEVSKSEFEEMLKSLQDELVLIKPQGAHESVVAHLAHPQDKVVGQAMAFLAALVYNGNEKAQQKIGQCLRNRDTELFTRMDSILETASAHIKADPSRVVRRTHVVQEEADGEASDTPEEKDGIELAHLQSRMSTDQSPIVQTKSFWQLEENGETKRHLVVILDLVAWMCDGQKMENQELFREQETQFNSVNLVSQIAILLQVVVEPLTDEYILIARKAIQALIELCAGNFANQQTAFKAQIVETINSILRRRDTGTTECQELLELKSSALELLNTLLEETSHESFDLLWGISQDIDTDTILEAMLDLWETNKSDPTREDARKGLFDAFHILKKIADNLRKPVKKYVEFDEQVEAKDDSKAASLQEMWQDLQKWSRSIEVVYHTEEQKEVLTRVYFPFDPQEQMTGKMRDFISGKIERGSPEDKVKDLLEWMSEVYDTMKHKKFVAHHRLLRWSYFLSGPRHYTLMLLTLLLNLLTIIFFKVPTNEAGETVDDHNSSVFVVTARIVDVPLGYYVALYLLGSFHFILSCWMLEEYFVTILPNLSIRMPIMEELLWEVKKLIVRHSVHSDLSKNRILKLIQRPKEQEHFGIYFFSFGPIYRILFFSCSLLSLAFSGYWYSGCLLYLFLNIVVLEQVLTALRRSALQLLIVFLLGLCITFMYAVVSFAFLHGYFDRESGLFCETLAECFATVTREGLLDTLGTAIPLQTADQDTISRSLYVWRLFIDLSFFIIVTTIGLNVVVAILVDTFSALRQQRDEINEDRKNYCFICGKDNDEFERKAEGFQKHITNDHHMWNYIYFYLHLRKVKPSDHNAMEKYVYDQIEKQSIQFFPLRKAKVLMDQEKASFPKDGGTAAASGQKEGSPPAATK